MSGSILIETVVLLVPKYASPHFFNTPNSNSTRPLSFGRLDFRFLGFFKLGLLLVLRHQPMSWRSGREGLKLRSDTSHERAKRGLKSVATRPERSYSIDFVQDRS